MKKLSIILLGIFSFTACLDLDEDPAGLLAPESFFETPKDVETAVLGAYGLLASEKLYGRKLSLSLQLRSDMCSEESGSARRQQVDHFTMDAQNEMVASIWPKAYKVIGAANIALFGAEKISKPELEEQLMPLKAEARFARAFTYYHLVRLFGNIPYIDFYVTDLNDVGDISQTDSLEVYDNIIADLNFAKEYLPYSHPNGTRTRPTKGTAAAYLASVHLTLASEYYNLSDHFQKAYEHAKWVIDTRNTLDYRLEDDFQDLFRASNAAGLKEPLLVLDFLANQSNDGQNYDAIAAFTGIKNSDNGGFSISVPSMKVYDTWDSLDYRKQVSMDTFAYYDGVWKHYSEFRGEKRPHIAKFSRFHGNSESSGSNSDNNYALMRYAEVLLMAAEASNELNRSIEALGYLNQVRERARNGGGFPPDATVMDQPVLRDTIREERRLELAFEFKRWYDIQRWKKGMDFFSDNGLEEREFKPCKDYLFPIPADELARNPNLTQNPCYD